MTASNVGNQLLNKPSPVEAYGPTVMLGDWGGLYKLSPNYLFEQVVTIVRS